MNWPKISIITPCFNQVNYIEQTIRSVLDQNYPNLEYIIIDGESTDGTTDVIKSYENQLTYWISEPDNGMYDALQKGFERATGNILGWINSDDLLHNGSLNTIAEIFDSYSEVDWLQGMPSFFDEKGRIVQTGPFKKWSAYHFYLGDFKWIQQESTFWRRSLWERAGGNIDKRFKYAGDFELWLRFFRHAKLYSCTALIGGFRLRSSGQLSQTHINEYLKEAHSILEYEISILPPGKKKKLSILKKLMRVYGILKKLRILNASGFYSKAFGKLIEFTPTISFDRSTQSYLLK
ncbi:MAG: glycosyltransferase [Lewinellaceae bacterium]|nr:glycosyltransferase [Lewinellaceae bacterium]